MIWKRVEYNLDRPHIKKLSFLAAQLPFLYPVDQSQGNMGTIDQPIYNIEFVTAE